MNWSAYEVFAVLSGVILVGSAMALSSEPVKERVQLALSGLAIGGFGLWVASQEYGTFHFPVQIFLIPVGALGWAGYKLFFERPESVEPDPSSDLNRGA